VTNRKKTTKVKLNRGFCVQTRNGEHFDPKVGKLSAVVVDDIAHALSNLCRFSGHCRSFYSVAEHSVLVSRIIRDAYPQDTNAIWAGLLHDATEAYVGDITTPLKDLLPQFKELEEQLAVKIAKKFKIRWDERTLARVKTADLIALSTEAKLLFEDISQWDIIKSYESKKYLVHPLFPVSPMTAKRMFMKEFERVLKEIENE
jgi:5'-deoxynucleotidase YfbR-like HD superfamily hydrolase